VLCVFDIRRALPAVPLGTCAGLHTTYTLSTGGLLPAASVVGGVVMLGLAAVMGYRVAAGWSERARRQVGYGTSVLLGLAIGAILVFLAFGVSLCGLWGETCSPDELALAAGCWSGRWRRSSASRADTPSSTW
jgi:hypothetical protein